MNLKCSAFCKIIIPAAQRSSSQAMLYARITLSRARFLPKLFAAVQFLGHETSPPRIVQSFQCSLGYSCLNMSESFGVRIFVPPGRRLCILATLRTFTSQAKRNLEEGGKNLNPACRTGLVTRRMRADQLKVISLSLIEKSVASE